MKVSIKYLFLLISVLLLLSATAADTIPMLEKMRTGARQISEIRNNGILLRLRGHQRAKEALRAAGNEEGLRKLEQRVKEENSQIIEAFRHFTFAPVYYYMDYNTSLLKNGDFSEVYNLDGSRASYSAQTSYIIDPYSFENSTTNSLYAGFALLDINNRPLTYPMPATLMRRRGFVRKSYIDMVIEYSHQFSAMDKFAERIRAFDGRAELSKKEMRNLREERRDLWKEARKKNRTKPS